MMATSKLSNVISTTRLLKHFSVENANTMKRCIYTELGCVNEAEFLCKILFLIYKTLTNESTSIIKQKALEIADSQEMEQATTPIISKRNTTVYKYVQQQYNDRLCGLHSDIIDYLGTFLNKQESIEFGYLNKQLFIETQKQSYLLKRCKDDTLWLNSNNIDKLYHGNTDGFNYTFPKDIVMNFDRSNVMMVKNMPFFKNFFRRLSSLQCKTLYCLNCVLFDLLLNKNSNCNYYQENESQDNIKRLHIGTDIFFLNKEQSKENRTANCYKDLDMFCTYWDNHIKSMKLNSNGLTLRWIERLEIRTLALESSVIRLLTRIGTISKCIQLQHTKLTIVSIKELEEIFHSRLNHIEIDQFSQISIEINDDTTSSTSTKNSNNIIKNSNMKLGFLEKISIHSDNKWMGNYTACINTLNGLDIFSMRRNVTEYNVISEQEPLYYGTESDSIMENLCIYVFRILLDKILFQDCDKHPLLETIKITLKDDFCLFGLMKCLAYINQNYNQLFIQRKSYLKNFKKIEIDILKICCCYINEEPSVDIRACESRFIVDGYQMSKEVIAFLQQKFNKEYSIDDNEITMHLSAVKKGVESFGTVFRNIFHWLQRKQHSQMAINGCKITFVID